PVAVAAAAAPNPVASAASAGTMAISAAPSVAAMATASNTSIAPATATFVSAGEAPAATAAPALPVEPAGIVTSTMPAEAPVVRPGVVASVPDDAVFVPEEPDGVPTEGALDRFLAGYDGGDCFAASVVRDESAMLAAFAVDFVDSVALQLALGET